MELAVISLVIPVYRNEENIPPLLEALDALHRDLGGRLEVVFVVDGSPDNSAILLKHLLPAAAFRSQLLLLSRNFGSFAAIQAGLSAGTGQHFAVMAADLQEPPSLILEFDRILASGKADITVGLRTKRDDGILAGAASGLFWLLYRRLVIREIPPGGVDVFGCTGQVRNLIGELKENNSSLVGLLFWAGFRRESVPYVRAKREIGTSAWTFSKKFRYLSNSIFSFTDLPIRALTFIGILGLVASTLLALLTLVARLTGTIEVPGYAATVLIVTFFGGLNCLGLGVVGNYVWRSFENTKGRPPYVVASSDSFSPTSDMKSGA
jgi:glycosyltransferase involved in cell wall biosynthesis